MVVTILTLRTPSHIFNGSFKWLLIETKCIQLGVPNARAAYTGLHTYSNVLVEA